MTEVFILEQMKANKQPGWGNKKITLFLLRLVSGFHDLLLKLLAEKLGTFGSNTLKFPSRWEWNLYTTIGNVFIPVPKSSYVKAKEFAMRKPFHKRRVLEIHLFRNLLETW